jgi:ADP-ribosylglycohydrolase
MICSKSGKKVSGDFLTKYSNIFKENKMIGAIAGDVIGSVFEHYAIKSTQFELFSPHSRYTDDTALTVAIEDAIMRDVDYAISLKTFGARYPNAGYGASFFRMSFAKDMNVKSIKTMPRNLKT